MFLSTLRVSVFGLAHTRLVLLRSMELEVKSPLPSISSGSMTEQCIVFSLVLITSSRLSKQDESTGPSKDGCASLYNGCSTDTCCLELESGAPHGIMYPLCRETESKVSPFRRTLFSTESELMFMLRNEGVGSNVFNLGGITGATREEKGFVSEFSDSLDDR